MNNKRRKELRRAIEIIETALDIVNQVKDEEEDSMCNYPENLQGTETYENMEVAVDENLESCCKGVYVIGDGSGITHSLSHASASGVYVARYLANET